MRIRARSTRLLLTAVGTALALTACASERVGSGVEASEQRAVDSFDRIDLSGQATVVVGVGGSRSVTVRGDDNLLDDVKTEVHDATLEISESSDVDLSPKVGITVEITVPDLQAVEVSGVGNIEVDGIQGDAFRAEISGAGKVEATGKVDRVDAEISGTGALRLSKLIARAATVEVSGAGSAHVHATESLSASVSGAGAVVYAGQPEDVETNVSGAGDVRAG